MGFVIKKSLKIGKIEKMTHKRHLTLFLEFSYFSQFCIESLLKYITKICSFHSHTFSTRRLITIGHNVLMFVGLVIHLLKSDQVGSFGPSGIALLSRGSVNPLPDDGP